jgi:hypothetical protein
MTFSSVDFLNRELLVLERIVRLLSELIGLRIALQDQAEAEGFEPSVEVLAPTTV